MIKDMFQLQKDYDAMVFEAHGIEGYEQIREQIPYALLDEIGELNHELKSRWCWWKRTQQAENREAVLEEFVDVIHFILMRELATETEEEFIKEFTKGPNVPRPGWDALDLMRYVNSGSGVTFPFTYVTLPLAYAVQYVALSLGFTWDQVYEAYKQKNAVNRLRVENGY